MNAVTSRKPFKSSFPLTDDEIQEMHDDKLSSIERSLKNKIEALHRKGVDTVTDEIEHCYIRREIDHRLRRQAAHRAYMEKTRPAFNRTPGFDQHNKNDRHSVVPVAPRKDLY